MHFNQAKIPGKNQGKHQENGEQRALSPSRANADWFLWLILFIGLTGNFTVAFSEELLCAKEVEKKTATTTKNKNELEPLRANIRAKKECSSLEAAIQTQDDSYKSFAEKRNALCSTKKEYAKSIQSMGKKDGSQEKTTDGDMCSLFGVSKFADHLAEQKLKAYEKDLLSSFKELKEKFRESRALSKESIDKCYQEINKKKTSEVKSKTKSQASEGKTRDTKGNTSIPKYSGKLTDDFNKLYFGKNSFYSNLLEKIKTETEKTRGHLKVLTDHSLSATEKEKLCSSQIKATGSSSNAKELGQRFNEFMKKFNKENSGASNGTKKAKLLRGLVKEFGEKDADRIVRAMTAYGEADHRKDRATQEADIAAVLKVIDNRANTNGFSNATILKDLGISRNENTKGMYASLAKLQFSIWNDNLAGPLVNYNPTSAQQSNKMDASFDTLGKIESGKIEYVKGFERNDVYNYHANYVSPGWANSSKIVQPWVRIHNDNGSYQDINVSKIGKPYHIFYKNLQEGR